MFDWDYFDGHGGGYGDSDDDDYGGSDYGDFQFLRPDGGIESKSKGWFRTNGFFEVMDGLYSGEYFEEKEFQQKYVKKKIEECLSDSSVKSIIDMLQKGNRETRPDSDSLYARMARAESESWTNLQDTTPTCRLSLLLCRLRGNYSFWRSLAQEMMEKKKDEDDEDGGEIEGDNIKKDGVESQSKKDGEEKEEKDGKEKDGGEKKDSSSSSSSSSGLFWFSIKKFLPEIEHVSGCKRCSSAADLFAIFADGKSDVIMVRRNPDYTSESKTTTSTSSNNTSNTSNTSNIKKTSSNTKASNVDVDEDVDEFQFRKKNTSLMLAFSILVQNDAKKERARKLKKLRKMKHVVKTAMARARKNNDSKDSSSSSSTSKDSNSDSNIDTNIINDDDISDEDLLKFRYYGGGYNHRFSRFCSCDNCDYYRRMVLSGEDSDCKLWLIGGKKRWGCFSGFRHCKHCDLDHDIYSKAGRSKDSKKRNCTSTYAVKDYLDSDLPDLHDVPGGSHMEEVFPHLREMEEVFPPMKRRKWRKSYKEVISMEYDDDDDECENDEKNVEEDENEDDSDEDDYDSDEDESDEDDDYDEEEDDEEEDFDMDGYYFTQHDMYKKDESDSAFVRAAGRGDLISVREEIEEAKKLPRSVNVDISVVGSNKKKSPKKKSPKTYESVLNGARIWKEVQEKYGYDKEWDWHGDTALIAAARAGHDQVVRIYLQILFSALLLLIIINTCY